jgi:hypothetical protein
VACASRPLAPPETGSALLANLGLPVYLGGMKLFAIVFFTALSMPATVWANNPCQGSRLLQPLQEAKRTVDQVLDSSDRLRGQVMSTYVGTCSMSWMAEALEMATDEVPSEEYCGVRIELNSREAIAGFAASALLTGPRMSARDARTGTDLQVPFCVVHREHNRSH